jgi:hypothetical protein
MSSNNDMNYRKRKPTTIPETVSSNDEGQNPKDQKKARRVSATRATPVVKTEHAATANTASIEYEELISSIGKMVEDLCHSDNTKVNAALVALDQDFIKDEKKYESFVSAGGCLALVLLLKKCLDKAIDTIPACDQVTELNELAELTTLYNTLDVIIFLTSKHHESQVGISTISGVEVVVKAMKTFPKCAELLDNACHVVAILALCSIGRAKIIESGGIDFLLAVVKNNLDSEIICENACWALSSIVHGSRENTGLLIALGGAAAVAKIRTKWPDNEDVQVEVRALADLIGSEMKAWADEE